MSMMDNTIWLAYVLAEAILVGLLLYKRVWRVLPFFFVYCVWDLLSNIGSFATRQFLTSDYSNYLSTYLIQTIVDSAFQFCILVELAWSVLRPIRASLPRYALFVLSALILTVGAVIWPFASAPGLSQVPAQVQLIVHLQQTVSILRILFFLGLAGCSQLLSIGWRDRELQVATGLGLYSLVGLGVTLLQTHQIQAMQYKTLNELVIGTFALSLLYWVFCFAQRQPERREFTPQMQNLLLAVAGAARANRAALSDRSDSDIRFRHDD
jgi:hypothetical protein